MKAPCYNCERRSALCYAQCVAYAEWAAKMKAVNDHLHKDKESIAYMHNIAEKWRRRQQR